MKLDAKWPKVRFLCLFVRRGVLCGMDILADLFREAGLQRRLLDMRHLSTGRALRFPCDRSLGFHVVLEGTAWVHAPCLVEPLELHAGDIAVMGRGCDHLLAVTADIATVPADAVTLVHDGFAEGGGDTTVVSGAYQLWNAPLHPLFAELPEWHVVRAERTTRLEPLGLALSMLAAEVQQDELGRESIVHGLVDVLFTYLMRDIVARRGSEGSPGWSHAVADAHIRRAVAALHDDCARAWTLESLARAVNLSRSVLAERFREAMGDTPLSYLRTVRLQRAMRLLAEGNQTLEQVALAVGYHDAFGFSKAFKRAVGVSPGEYRKRNDTERNIPWRFTAQDAVSAG
jgi:AraC-like DNA-binding protein